MPKRKKRRGHYCWACGCIRANERFSGRGHARHVCRDCSRLGADALAEIQTIRDAERLLRGKWRRNQRKRRQILDLTEHASPRVRTFAIDLLYSPFAWLADDSTMSFAWLETDRAWPDSFDDECSRWGSEFECESDWPEEFSEHAFDSDASESASDDFGIVWDDLDSIQARLDLGVADDCAGGIEARLDVDEAPLTSEEMVEGLRSEDLSQWFSEDLVAPVDKLEAFGPRPTFSLDDMNADFAFDDVPF